MKERCYNCGSDKHLALQCPYIKTGPAPKEEEMDENHPVIGRLMDVAEKAVCDAARTTERRALARDAYMAALGGLMPLTTVAPNGIAGIVYDAQWAALETVRRWDAFMAAVDAEGGE